MLQKIRRRDLILLSGLVSLACFSMITVVLLILRSQPEPAASAPANAGGTPGPAPTHTVTFVQVTGLSQYPLAETAAAAWADDAQLVSANANWSRVLEVGQVGTPTTWNYRFYSPAKKRLFFVFVTPEGTVRTIEHRVPVTLPPLVVDLDEWQVDTPVALAVWLDYGGSKLLRNNPGLEVVAQLRRVNNNPDPVWMVIGLDKRTDDLHVVVIDANQGAVVTTSPES